MTSVVLICESGRIWAVKYGDQRNTQLTLYLVFIETIITHVSRLNIKPERTRFLSCSEVEILKIELTLVVTKAVKQKNATRLLSVLWPRFSK